MSWWMLLLFAWVGTASLAAGSAIWCLLRDSARRRAGLKPKPMISNDEFAVQMLLLLWPLTPLALLSWLASVLLSKHYVRAHTDTTGGRDG